MDDSELFQRQHTGLKHFYRMLSRAAPSSRLIERDGVTATLVPAVPDRSFMNAVIYDDQEALAGMLGELGRLYAGAGVNAWTVWVPAHHKETGPLLEQAGHTLDATPLAMARELADWTPEPSRGTVVEEDADVGDLARINNVAYGYEPGQFERGLTERPAGLLCYAARVDGDVVACSAALDHGDDCCVTFVASLPDWRGRGLASDLMSHMLAGARERGCATTSLQATRAGRPIYDRLGYRDLGALEMWERRAAPAE